MLKHLSRIVTAVLLAGAVTAGPALSADLQQIIASGKVRIGVPVDVAPFGSNDANNQPVGLDVDMANNIAKALGVTLELQQLVREPVLGRSERYDVVLLEPPAARAPPPRCQQLAANAHPRRESPQPVPHRRWNPIARAHGGIVTLTRATLFA
jgi:polar amino acid transport system substrate-binding protein